MGTFQLRPGPGCCRRSCSRSARRHPRRDVELVESHSDPASCCSAGRGWARLTFAARRLPAGAVRAPGARRGSVPARGARPAARSGPRAAVRLWRPRRRRLRLVAGLPRWSRSSRRLWRRSEGVEPERRLPHRRQPHAPAARRRGLGTRDAPAPRRARPRGGPASSVRRRARGPRAHPWACTGGAAQPPAVAGAQRLPRRRRGPVSARRSRSSSPPSSGGGRRAAVGQAPAARHRARRRRSEAAGEHGEGVLQRSSLNASTLPALSHTTW